MLGDIGICQVSTPFGRCYPSEGGFDSHSGTLIRAVPEHAP
jgi:hypothetical protein